MTVVLVNKFYLLNAGLRPAPRKGATAPLTREFQKILHRNIV